MAVFGYIPTGARKTLVNGIDNLEDLENKKQETSEDEEDVIRCYVREQLAHVYYFGLKRGNIDDIKNYWPKLFSYLSSNYSNFLSSCVVALKSKDKLSQAVPYVLLLDDSMTTLTWNSIDRCPVYVQSEDITRAVERFK
jgi:hypothetical protein